MEPVMTLITSISTTSYVAESTIADNSVNLNNHANLLSRIKLEINNGIQIVKENLENGFAGDIEALEKVLQLLNSLTPTEAPLKIINQQTTANKSSYTVTSNNKKLFTITNITGETRFPTTTTRGDDFIINLKDGFNELYNQIYAPGYDVIDEPETFSNASTYALV